MISTVVKLWGSAERSEAGGTGDRRVEDGLQKQSSWV